MNLHAPNIALFVIGGCLAIIGIMAALPVNFPIPGFVQGKAAWCIFLAWFLVSAACVLPQQGAQAVER
jgi:hypothetical protein